MKLSSPLVAIACSLALFGCSTPTKVDSGAIHANTFNFINPGPRTTPQYADKSAPVHAAIQQAITRNLGNRGLSKVAAGGDVTVAYLLILGNNASTTSLNEYFGYREDSADLLDKAHAAYTEKERPNYFEAGTLVIDLIDTKTNKLLRRGYASRPLLQNPTEDARAARVQEVVDEILRNVQIAH